MRVVPAAVRDALTSNILFVIVVTPAVLLRADAELGYRWQSWFNDSWNYVDTAVTLNLDPTRASGYSFYLWLLKPAHSFALVTVSQHVMGLLVGVMIYALARHRFGAPEWLAVLIALPVLYDGFEIQLEHLIMSDTLFLFLAMLAVMVLLWSPLRGGAGWRWSLPRCAAAGALIGVSSIVRATGLPLIPVFALYLVVCLAAARVGWRALAANVAAFLVLAVAPLAGYASWYDLQHGAFNTSESTGVFLYSRVMTFADCSRMQLTPDLLPLCTTVPPAQRPIAQAYIWTDASPLKRFPPPVFSALPNSLAEQFAIRAIEAQPLDYVRTAWDDTVRSFDWPRTVFPNGKTYDQYLFGRHSVAIARGHRVPGYPSSAAAYLNGGNPVTAVVNPFARLIRDYQRYIWLPGTVYGLLLLAGLVGVVFRWRRGGREALLPWLSSVALIAVPAATAEFDYRYVTTAVPFACLAVAVAFGTAGRARLGASGGPDGRLADAGHDQRNLTTDAS